TARIPTIPTVDSAAARDGVATIAGRVIGFAGSSSISARVDVYGSPTCDPGPQGAIPLGYVPVNPLTGRWQIEVSALPPGARFVTATTSQKSVTSPFSTCEWVNGQR
ncbi:MAG TPA: hypothetical protein VHM24_01940, partial [Gemmatimonadaceae bacterium]|nr:hypothetical protein [Gemmatimonadaceae bacterium]